MNATSVESVSIPTTLVALGDDSNHHHVVISQQRVQIALDPDEQALFETLVAAAQAYNTGVVRPDDAKICQQKEPLVFRVAGGWVRDKLLQLQTHDVDVAVNILTGAQAALLVKLYLQHQKQQPDIPPRPPPQTRQLTAGKIGVIAANPEQSKHLETATMKIGAIDVDFCNLRDEESYQANSRIPTTVIFGTPLQDAMRRDFTLNALFYNTMTAKVEDWTGRGLPDLMAGQLVTPLDPLQTFQDDPLRVLRAIRFAVRYQFRLDPALEQAAMNLTIHQALHVKVSRERVGKELEGMLSGKGANPELALRIISRLRLAGSVFSLPIVGQDKVTFMRGCIGQLEYHDANHNGVQARHVRELGWEASLQMLDLFVSVVQAHEQRATTGPTHDKRLSAVAAFLLPFRTLCYKEGNKGREFLAVEYVFRHGIKFKNADVQFITQIMENLNDMVALLTSAATNPLVSRLDAGLLLQSVKDLWVTCLLLATVVKMEEQNRLALPTVDWIQVSIQVYHAILDLRLDGCWEMKPLLNGTALIQTLDLPRGPLVRTYQDEQVRWMLQNPQGSREDCEAHLQSFKRKLEAQDDESQEVVGMSDGTGKTPSSPIHASKKTADHPHFSKKMHVESMEL